jgi:lipid-A-disaccharide synthase
MPNLLAGEKIYPEFVQDQATGSNLAAAALELMRDEKRRAEIRAKLDAVIGSLGEPGASDRAARYISELVTC